MSDPPQSHSFSHDVLLFAALLGPYLLVPHEQGIMVPALLVFGTYAFHDTVGRAREAAGSRLWFAKWTLSVVAIALVTLAPTALAIVWRLQTAPYRFVHDGLIQSEEAVRFVLAGKNPYVEDYRNTPMAQWPFRDGGLTQNPALDHYAYLPVTFLLPLPFQAWAETAWGWFDQRLVYLVLFAGILLLSHRIANRPNQRTQLLLVLGLNPMFVLFFVQGRNDVVPLFGVVLAICLLQRRRMNGATVSLALACAAKQTAWFFVPFYFAYVAGRGKLAQRIVHLRRPLLLFSAVFLIAVLPWALADPRSFLIDVLAYPSGSSVGGYPITGFGFSALLLSFGLIKSSTAMFPFWVFQVGIGLPVLWALLRRQVQENRLRQAIMGYAVLLFVISFFARAFNDNYVGYIVSLIALAAFVDEPLQSERDWPASRVR